MRGSTPTRRHTLRRAVGACLATALALCLALVALAAAQGGGADAQSITVTGSNNTATLAGADGLRPGPAEVTLRVKGRKAQNVVLARLRPGVEVADVQRYARRLNNVPVNLVSLDASAFMGPGETLRTTINLFPGRYLAIGEDGLNRGLGGFKVFDVAGVPFGGELPAADASILMYDYGFRIPKKIDGNGLLRIENIGRNEHFIIGIRLDKGADPADVKRKLIAAEDFEPPGEFVNIIGVVSPGTTNVIQARLKRGVYVLACFYSDRASAGHGHNEFGMVRQATIR
jgi:hypothetical protein